ncbi:hypothetical protein LTR17_005622 [Elasticomyces elasticus]|nr:hypothetical protein LTR17_005622 [Elasticomyces elasticus]
MADRRGVLIPLLIIGWIFFGPQNAAQNASRLEQQRPSYDEVIADEERSLEVLRNSSYGDLNSPYGNLLNLTGLEDDRGYAWDGLSRVQEKAKERLRYALGDAGIRMLEGEYIPEAIPALYSNVTGHAHGKWTRSKLQESIHVPQLNLSQYASVGPFGPLPPTSFSRNITGDEGDVRIRFYERTPYEQDAVTGEANITGMSVEMALQESGSGDETQLQLYGVYDMNLGQATLSTTSDKMAGIFMLPHFALSQHAFESARSLLNQSLAQTIRAQQSGWLMQRNPWPSNVEGSTPNAFDAPQCELIVYLQQLPPSGSRTAALSSDVLKFIERELRFPTGAFLPSAPELRFSMLAFSPDCGYILESKGEPDYVPIDGEHLSGPKVEVLQDNGRHHLMIFAATLGGQIVLLMRQMREASTPSTRGRISFFTIAMLGLGDGYAAMAFLLISLFVGGLQVQLEAAAFLAFTSVLFFGMRFLLEIWTAHAPERAARARVEAEEERQRQERFDATLARLQAERLERVAAAGDTTTPASGDAVTTPSQAEGNHVDPTPAAPLPGTELAQLPLPVTAQRPTDTGATPIFMPSDQEGLVGLTATGLPTTATGEPRGTSFGSIYTRFYLVLLATLFISLNAASWPADIRRVFFTVLALAYLSCWVPQIIRNVQRNCRKALTLEFVVGQSALRLVPFVYFYAYKHNVLFAGRQLYSLAVLALWVWVQVVVLASQELIGPRWFIRNDWAPPAYDYHPVLREDEEGNTLPLGLSEATSDSTPTSPLLERRMSLSSPIARRGSLAKEPRNKGKRLYDCAICFQDLEVPVIEAGGSSDATLAGGLARRNYMVTPCRHIFHSACLEGWMKYRLQCPICRETLPPLPLGFHLHATGCTAFFMIAAMDAPSTFTSDIHHDQKHVLFERTPEYLEPSTDYDSPAQPSKHALDTALSHLALGVAALHRAGPHYMRLSEHLWFFAAGSWSWEEYVDEVKRARKLLPKRQSVAQDVVFAEAQARMAVDVLRREGDGRDAEDLMMAIEEVKGGCQL